jgi:hypothetical protein
VSLPDRYLALAFRVGKHEPELVENYYGPPEAVAPVEAEEPREPARLVEEAESLLADHEHGDLEPKQSAWIAGQTRALHTIARRLAGEQLSYAEEVEGTFGIEPVWYDEAEYERAHELLDEALPGSGDVRGRYARWFEETVVPREQLPQALRSMTEELQALSEAVVGLPEGETVELELVTGKRWSGFNRNLGELRSRISINADFPFQGGDLAYFLAHEAYPGHHVDGAWKEQVLVRERGQLEEALTLYAAPEAVLAEGVAELAIDVVTDDGGQELNARHLGALGIDFDAELGAKVFAARKPLRTVSSNLVLLRHERGASLEELHNYARRWSLQPDIRIERMVASLAARPFAGYTHCYPEGRRLCEAFVGGDPARFKRLLVEQLLPWEVTGGTPGSPVSPFL